jgi:hypothetical protein
LYSLGGFTLPFFSFGLLNILLSVGLILLMPNVKKETEIKEKKNDKKLTFSAMVEVNIDKLKDLTISLTMRLHDILPKFCFTVNKNF